MNDTDQTGPDGPRWPVDAGTVPVTVLPLNLPWEPDKGVMSLSSLDRLHQCAAIARGLGADLRSERVQSGLAGAVQGRLVVSLRCRCLQHHRRDPDPFVQAGHVRPGLDQCVSASAADSSSMVLLQSDTIWTEMVWDGPFLAAGRFHLPRRQRIASRRRLLGWA